MSAPAAWLASVEEKQKQMIPPVTIVVLGKYLDIFRAFYENAERFAPNVEKILVCDGIEIKFWGGALEVPRNWHVIQGPPTFHMAGNANLGWQAVYGDSDILYLGDDVRFVEENTVERLRSLAYSDPAIGIVYPALRGISSEEQSESYCRGIAEDLIYLKRGLPFVCIYLKREVIEKVGYLDEETFTGYGYEDDDYNRRVQIAGFKLAFAPHIVVEHASAQTTFKRNHGGDVKPVFAEMEANRIRYFQKWGEFP